MLYTPLRIRRWSAPLWGLVAAGLTASAFAQDAPVTLARKFQAGAVVRFQSTITANLMGMEVKVEETGKITAKEVKDDGSVVLVRTSEGGKLNLGGMEQPQPASPEVTVTRDKVGRLTAYKPAEPNMLFTPEISHLLTTLEEAVLPDKAVKNNDTWETSLDNPAAKDKKINARGTFLGREKRGEVELWKVKQSATADTGMADGKLTVELTAWLDPATGMPVRIEGDYKKVPSQFGELDWTQVTELKK